MCLIVDTNCLVDLCNGQDNMKPILTWLGFGSAPMGRLALCNHPKFQKEYFGKNAPRNLQRLLRTLSLLPSSPEVIDVGEVEKALSTIDFELKSDDHHIVGLALASGCKMLVSRDQRLHKDFKRATGGRIYQQAGKHKAMLSRYTCKEVQTK